VLLLVEETAAEEVVTGLAALEEGGAELAEADSEEAVAVGALLPTAGGPDAEAGRVAVVVLMVVMVVDGKVAVVVLMVVMVVDGKVAVVVIMMLLVEVGKMTTGGPVERLLLTE